MRISNVLSFLEVQEICDELRNCNNSTLKNLAKELANEEKIVIAILEEDEI